jgi:glycosyltransferase involved in cell wall biosynthesis
MISICIPAYNTACYLPETLESVRLQTFADWELIIVDDASADETPAIAESFAASVDQPVQVIRHSENRGLPSARNTAYAAAKGRYFALLDGDDLWTPDHLATLLHKAGDREVMVHAVSLLFKDHPQNVYMKREPLPTGSALENLFAGQYVIQPSSVLLHRRIVERVGDVRAFHGSGLGEDIDYWIRVARCAFPIECSARETCLYRKHDSAMSGKSAVLTEATARVRLAHIDAEVRSATWRRRIAASLFASAGRMYFRAEPSKAAALFFQAWRIRPDFLGCLFFAAAARFRAFS